MIPTIGAMMGAYIIAKMLWVINVKGDSKASVITKIFCIVAIIVSAVGIISLFTTNSSVPSFGMEAPAIQKFKDASIKNKISEIPVVMATYDHAQLAHLAETGSIATNLNQLIMDTTEQANSKWFIYAYDGAGKYTVTIKSGVTLGSLGSSSLGASSKVNIDGSIIHTVGDFLKYLPNFE